MVSTRFAVAGFAVAGALLVACGAETASSAGSAADRGSAGSDTPASAPAESPPEPPTGSPTSPSLDDPSPSLDDPSPTPDVPTSHGPTSGDSALTIIVLDGPGADPRIWELSCNPLGGTHPDAPSACAAILAVPGDPFAPVPPDTMCTQLYGGDQQAAVKGSWEGARVDAKFSRANGCEIARWDKLRGLFGTPIPPTRG